MELKRAKEVLEASILESFSREKLYSLGWYLYVNANSEKSNLDGEFTADQLEAIATWMRDPEGVVKA